jgi:hypothetical protein
VCEAAGVGVELASLCVSAAVLVCVCVREAQCQHCSVTFSSVSSAVGSVCAASFSIRLNYFAEGSTKLTRA